MEIQSHMSKKQTWEPFGLKYIGNIRNVVQGGVGKASITGGDPGEVRIEPPLIDGIKGGGQTYNPDR